MSKELNNIRKLAGLKLLETKDEINLEESVLPSVKKTHYSWGDLIVISVGADYSIPLHPKHQDILSDLKDTQTTSFVDETKRRWSVARHDDLLVFDDHKGHTLQIARSEIFDDLDEEVDHTRYGNESNPQSYELGSFDNKGRASLPNRYVQSRYGDNPLKNAKQIAKEGDITLESLAAEFDRYLSEGFAEESDDADEDIMVQAKDQLDEIDLDEGVSGPKFAEGDTIRRIGSETAIAKVVKVYMNPHGDYPEQAVYQLYWTANQTTTKLDSDVIDDSYELHNAISEDDASNFSSDDIKQLERIRDVGAAKQKAIELISRQSARSMKPNKVAWFKRAIMGKNSVADVIKLMYDLMLSGEGHGVVGSSGSMKPNSYRKQFGEEVDMQIEEGIFSKIGAGIDKFGEKLGVGISGEPKKYNLAGHTITLDARSAFIMDKALASLSKPSKARDAASLKELGYLLDGISLHGWSRAEEEETLNQIIDRLVNA